MKEFNLDATDIFNGISPKRVNKKNNLTLEKCHNLEPVDDDYDLHKLIIDMDADDYNWGNA